MRIMILALLLSLAACKAAPPPEWAAPQPNDADARSTPE
jgi:hypothetical protein